MPPRDPTLYLVDIVEAARAIEAFLSGRSAAEFGADELVASAVHSKLIIIGEAAANVPAAVRNAISGVDWPAIVRFRNLVVHAYFVVNLERMHGIATRDVPELAAIVLGHLRAEQAAAEGVSQQEWVRQVLRRTAARLSPAELLKQRGEATPMSEAEFAQLQKLVAGRRRATAQLLGAAGRGR